MLRPMSFDDAAATWDDPAKIELARAVAAVIRHRIPLTGQERVLDVGAGTGQLSLHLADAIGTATVSDASAGMVEVAARNIERAGLGDRLAVRQVDLTAGPLSAGHYDGVWSMLAFHHVPDVALLLERIHEVLRPGGWVAVVDLDDDPGGTFHRHQSDFDGHHGFDRDTFGQALARAGFTDVALHDAGSVDKEVEGGTEPFPLFLAVARRA